MSYRTVGHYTITSRLIKNQIKGIIINSNSDKNFMSWESDIFACSYCGKPFPKDPTKLALHIRNRHETIRGSVSNVS